MTKQHDLNKGRGTRMKRLTLIAAALVAVLLTAVGTSAVAKPTPPAPVTIQLLNVSDWHGNLDPVANTGGAWNISVRWP
jgi:ABC-type transport system substrate-binding protein